MFSLSFRLESFYASFDLVFELSGPPNGLSGSVYFMHFFSGFLVTISCMLFAVEFCAAYVCKISIFIPFRIT